MKLHRRTRRRLKTASIGLAGILAISSAGFAAVSLATPDAPPPASEQAAEYLETHATVDASAIAPRPVLAVVGDSFAMERTDAWPARTAFCTRHRLVMSGMGGTGFWNPGKNGVVYGDPERVEAVTKDNPAVIILESAYNDSFRAEGDPATLEQHIMDTVKAYQAAAPDANIVLVGPIWAIKPPTVGIENNRAALASAAEKTGVEYIDGGDWLPTEEYTGADLKHPNNKGHVQITADLVESLKTEGLVENTGGCELLS